MPNIPPNCLPPLKHYYFKCMTTNMEYILLCPAILQSIHSPTLPGDHTTRLFLLSPQTSNHLLCSLTGKKWPHYIFYERKKKKKERRNGGKKGGGEGRRERETSTPGLECSVHRPPKGQATALHSDHLWESFLHQSISLLPSLLSITFPNWWSSPSNT